MRRPAPTTSGEEPMLAPMRYYGTERFPEDPSRCIAEVPVLIDGRKTGERTRGEDWPDCERPGRAVLRARRQCLKSIRNLNRLGLKGLCGAHAKQCDEARRVPPHRRLRIPPEEHV